MQDAVAFAPCGCAVLVPAHSRHHLCDLYSLKAHRRRRKQLPLLQVRRATTGRAPSPFRPVSTITTPQQNAISTDHKSSELGHCAVCININVFIPMYSALI
eukprot:Opistho-2@70268